MSLVNTQNKRDLSFGNTPSTKANKSQIKIQEDNNRVEENLRVCCANHNQAVSNYKKYRNSIPNCFLAALFRLKDDLDYYNPENDNEVNDSLNDIDERYRKLAEAITQKIRPQITMTAE